MAWAATLESRHVLTSSVCPLRTLSAEVDNVGIKLELDLVFLNKIFYGQRFQTGKSLNCI